FKSFDDAAGASSCGHHACGMVRNMKDDLLYDKYISLILERDELEKEADLIKKRFVMELGDLIEKDFWLKIQCIKIKKILGEIVARMNAGDDFDPEEIVGEVILSLTDYYAQLEEIRSLKEDEGTITSAEAVKIKRIWRRISKTVHPDVLPEVFEDEKIRDLWERAHAAYKGNNLKALIEAEILIYNRLDELGIDSDAENGVENISEKIADIELEIEDIKTSEPYIFKFVLDDPGKLSGKKEEYMQSIKESEDYIEELKGPMILFGLDPDAVMNDLGFTVYDVFKNGENIDDEFEDDDMV
ncbi:MAG: hypothetical protein K5848_08385, partial [Lachnospiraceae bacterium]|nr:hypothetical protein [Lachnospiraceae bacterium]